MRAFFAGTKVTVQPLFLDRVYCVPLPGAVAGSKQPAHQRTHPGHPSLLSHKRLVALLLDAYSIRSSGFGSFLMIKRGGTVAVGHRKGK